MWFSAFRSYWYPGLGRGTSDYWENKINRTHNLPFHLEMWFVSFLLISWIGQSNIGLQKISTKHIYPFIWKCDLFHSYWYPGLRRATCDYWGNDNINRTPCFKSKLTKNYHWHTLPLKSYVSLLWHTYIYVNAQHSTHIYQVRLGIMKFSSIWFCEKKPPTGIQETHRNNSSQKVDKHSNNSQQSHSHPKTLLWGWKTGNPPLTLTLGIKKCAGKLMERNSEMNKDVLES